MPHFVHKQVSMTPLPEKCPTTFNLKEYFVTNLFPIYNCHPRGWRTEHEPTVCALSPDCQEHPGLHPNRATSRSRDGLCSCESPPGALHPGLESSAQEGPGPFGVGPEEATKTITGLKHGLLRRQAERAWVVQPGEGKALGRPQGTLPELKGS